jgi:hypothetical protein
MRQRFALVPDGKGGNQIVELALGAPPPQHAPAMISDSIPYRSPGLGEILQSQAPDRQYLRRDERLEIGNGEAMTRQQPWPQPEPAESVHRAPESDPAEPRAETDQSRTMSLDTAELESAPADGGASELALAAEVECMVDHTLADLEAAAQRGWFWFRDAQLYALFACVPLRCFAEAHEHEFRAYCGNVLRKDATAPMVIDPARASIESLAFALQVRRDPDARSMKRPHRAECANAIGWFACLCHETDPDKAVERARSLGRITGIAALYRKYKDEKDPSRQERAVKAKAARNARGTSQREAPPNSVPPSLVGDVPTEGPAAKSESLSAAATAVALARSALNTVDYHQITQLLDHLKDKVGIRPVVNPVARAPDQMIVVLLRVGDTIFGPICDKSICATAVAQVVTEHLQQKLPQEGLPGTDAV